MPASADLSVMVKPERVLELPVMVAALMLTFPLALRVMPDFDMETLSLNVPAIISQVSPELARLRHFDWMLSPGNTVIVAAFIGVGKEKQIKNKKTEINRAAFFMEGFEGFLIPFSLPDNNYC